jgi:hypothetical protein
MYVKHYFQIFKQLELSLKTSEKKKSQTSTLIKIRRVGAELFLADIQTDGQT